MSAPGRILAASAVGLGGLGLVLLFAPDEVGPVLGLLDPGAHSLPLELFASALFAVGFMDWTGRGALYGGIYGRPLALANLLLGALTAVALIREADSAGAWILAGVFTLHGAAFAWILFAARPWAEGPDGD